MENSIDMLNGPLQKNAPYLPDFIIRFVRGNDSSAVAVLSAGVGGFHVRSGGNRYVLRKNNADTVVRADLRVL